MKILIIEDEMKLAGLLQKGLAENGFTVDLCYDGQEGLHMAQNYPYDAILLDLMLPDMDGITILQALRARENDVPVLVVTARGEIEERVIGLDSGADDYIAKPFDLAELMARLRAAIRRSKGKPSPLIAVADLSIDTNAKTVSRAGRAITLSAREYALLEYLALNSGRVVSRAEMIEHIYETQYEWDSNVIDVYINYLRNKIDKGFSPPLLHTVRGAGYILRGQ
ncbi:MAG: DNA-binding response regulator [Deltaproteobacteria bacterium RIFOXYD12_FULL_57_12]|nr:MAG: DNA-binding response regulator [Deltaproteobacteria bacterium RIFOXYD12_FULL_57_12]